MTNLFRNPDALVDSVRAIMMGETNKNNKSDDGEGLDAVQPKAVKKKFKDRKDKDIDNDGDTDSSDEYLHKRRKAVSKAMKEESDIDEAKMSNGMLTQLKKAYEPMRDKKISMDNAKKLTAIMNKFGDDKDILIQLMKADIPFVSQGAVTKLIIKHGMKGAELNKMMKEEVDLEEKTKWKMGDGRPRGGAYIKNERFWNLDIDALKYIMKDADAAMKANPTGRKAGKYADEVNDASTVIAWRKKNGIKEEVDLEEEWTIVMPPAEGGKTVTGLDSMHVMSFIRVKGGQNRDMQSIKKGKNVTFQGKTGALYKVIKEGLGVAEDVDLDEEKMPNGMLTQLKKAYEPMRDKKISMDNAKKLTAIMNKFGDDKDILIQLMKADIPFVSQGAVTKLITKHGMKGAELNKMMKDVNMFTPSNFVDRGEYVFYNYRGEEKFVARFKRGGKASFIKFLKANFTPDEYFARRDKGETPLGILNSKGYVSPKMKKMMKEEVDLEEKTKWKMGDGRPRGGTYIENERFWNLDIDALKYIMKDADAAMKANPTGRKAGKYADEVNDASTVIAWRKKNGIKEEVDLEEGFINLGGAKVKDDEKSILQHIKKTFPNVKKVKKDSQHGWIPVFEEVDLDEARIEDVLAVAKDNAANKHSPKGRDWGKLTATAAQKLIDKEMEKLGYAMTAGGKWIKEDVDENDEPCAECGKIHENGCAPEDMKEAKTVKEDDDEDGNEKTDAQKNDMDGDGEKDVKKKKKKKNDDEEETSKPNKIDTDPEIKTSVSEVYEKKDSDGGDENLMMALRKAVSLRGQYNVAFKDGKKVKVSMNDALTLLNRLQKEKPINREALMKSAYKSEKHFKMALKGKVEPKKNPLDLD